MQSKSLLLVTKSKLCDGQGLFTLMEINKNKIIAEVKGRMIYGDLTNIHNPYALQLDFNKYIIPNNITRYINHSCNPNCKIEISNKKVYLKSIRNISAGEELTYDYNTTEYDMGIDQFECQCGSNNCIGKVKGFRYLPLQRRLMLRDYLLPYLKVLIPLKII